MLFIKSRNAVAAEDTKREDKPLDPNTLFQGLITDDEGSVIIDPKLAAWRSPILHDAESYEYTQIIYTSRYRHFEVLDREYASWPRVIRVMTVREVVAWLLRNGFEIPPFITLSDYVE